MRKDKLTTKEFADLCKVEKRTLFFYDEIDLLKPVETSEKGYRLYSMEQFDTMSMIKALQSVGMSLNEIKELMNEQDISHCKSVLNNQINLLRQKQKELKMAEEILSQTMEHLDRFLEIGCNRFFIDELPEVCLFVKEMQGKNAEVFINYITNGYHNGVVINDMVKGTPQYVYKIVPDRKSANDVKAAGAYACIYLSIQNGKVVQAIGDFMKMLSERKIVTEGPLYLEDLASDFIRFQNQELIFLLSIRCSTNSQLILLEDHNEGGFL